MELGEPLGTRGGYRGRPEPSAPLLGVPRAPQELPSLLPMDPHSHPEAAPLLSRHPIPGTERHPTATTQQHNPPCPDADLPFSSFVSRSTRTCNRLCAVLSAANRLSSFTLDGREILLSFCAAHAPNCAAHAPRGCGDGRGRRSQRSVEGPQRRRRRSRHAKMKTN